MSAAAQSTSCSSVSFCPYVCMAVPRTISTTFLKAPTVRQSASSPSSMDSDAPVGDNSSSWRRLAAGMRPISPLRARRISMPGISMRLISFVPSKIRFTRASLSMEEGLEADWRTVGAFKKVVLMVLGTAMQTYGQKLTDEQEVLCAAADILIDTYAAESAVLRARDAVASSRPDAALHEASARTFVNDATQRVQASATNALAAMVEGDALRTLLAALRRVLKPTPVNTVALRRTLADATVARGSYS